MPLASSVQLWQTVERMAFNFGVFQILAAYPTKLVQNKFKEVVVIELANKNGHKMFKCWDLRGNEMEDRNNGQNLCKYSWHVPSSNLHNKPIAAAWRCFSKGVNCVEHNCSARFCIWSNLDSWVGLAPIISTLSYSATGCTKRLDKPKSSTLSPNTLKFVADNPIFVYNVEVYHVAPSQTNKIPI